MANSTGRAVGDADFPATHAKAVTPHDSDGFDRSTRALYIGGSGDVSVEIPNESDVTATVLFSSVPAGILPIRCTRVNSTNTTATNIVALW